MANPIYHMTSLSGQRPFLLSTLVFIAAVLRLTALLPLEVLVSELEEALVGESNRLEDAVHLVAPKLEKRRFLRKDRV